MQNDVHIKLLLCKSVATTPVWYLGSRIFCGQK